jgi:cobalt-zinc-cadmium resistance protein CzcA
VVDALAAQQRRTWAPATSSATASSILVRVPGQVADLEAIGDIVLDPRDGVPIRVRDVADVGEGPELRTGAATQNGEEVVLGTVFMLVGENSRACPQARGEARRRSSAACPRA